MGASAYVGDSPWANACVRLLSEGMTADGSGVYLVGETVLKVSPPAYPKVVREMTDRARAARTALGPALGSPIPVPLDEWEMNGVSCALFEKLVPVRNEGFKGYIERRKIVPHVLQWLRSVAALDRGDGCPAEECLRALASCPYRQLGDAATAILPALKNKTFVPRARVMHGDFWLGNVLFDPAGVHDFMIIDWRGSTANGFGIFDLVKFAESARLSSRALRTEVEAHARRLGCSLQDTRAHLLAALGYIWLNLEQFPPERFAIMAERNLRTLEAALCLSSRTARPSLPKWQKKSAGRTRLSGSLAPQII